MIYINGAPLNEQYVQHTDKNVLFEKRDNFGPLNVPEGNLFVMGDNRDLSYDSRYWGFVPIENVIAQAIKIYWSWDKANFNVRWDRIGTTIK